MEKQRLIITLFGATGDLAARKLYPAIYQLYKKGHICEHFALIGTARREWSNEYFRQVVLDSINDAVEDQSHAEEFVSHFYYQPHNVHDQDHYDSLRNLATELEAKYDTQGNRIFYISLSPALFPVITQNLKDQNLLTDQGYNRLIIEKPFGSNSDSAKELQAKLNHAFDESQIYRIDHYLGKSLVHALADVRFGNTPLEALWNKTYIDHFQITLAEAVGVEARGDYYETSGVTKDMLQNHILQLLALVAMRKPVDTTADSLRAHKIEVLSHLRLYEDADDMRKHTIRGQYGQSADGELPAYRSEMNVAEDSSTETYFAAQIDVEMPEWEGVPFFVRSGKRMSHKFTTIDVVFKSEDSEEPNRLQIQLEPNTGYYIAMNTSAHDFQKKPVQIPLSYQYSVEALDNMPGDYERLIHDCILGYADSFNHYQEVVHQWKFVDRIHKLWANMPAPNFPNYPAKSLGPEHADELIQRHNPKAYWYSDL